MFYVYQLMKSSFLYKTPEEIKICYQDTALVIFQVVVILKILDGSVLILEHVLIKGKVFNYSCSMIVIHYNMSVFV